MMVQARENSEVNSLVESNSANSGSFPVRTNLVSSSIPCSSQLILPPVNGHECGNEIEISRPPLGSDSTTTLLLLSQEQSGTPSIYLSEFNTIETSLFEQSSDCVYGSLRSDWGGQLSDCTTRSVHSNSTQSIHSPDDLEPRCIEDVIERIGKINCGIKNEKRYKMGYFNSFKKKLSISTKPLDAMDDCSSTSSHRQSIVSMLSVFSPSRRHSLASLLSLTPSITFGGRHFSFAFGSRVRLNCFYFFDRPVNFCI